MTNNPLHNNNSSVGDSGAGVDNLQLLKTTIDSSLNMIQVFKAVRNGEGEIVDFVWVLNNAASMRIYGDVIGKSLLQLQPGVVEEGIFDAFRQVVETGDPMQYEKHYVHEQFDGWYHQSVVKLNDGVATTTANITKLKRAEQELLKSKTLLQNIIDAPRIGMAVYKAVRNESGEIIDFVHEYINRASIEMLGGEDFTGKPFAAHGENALDQMPKFIQAIETGTRNSYTREANLIGQTFWFAITNTPLDEDQLVHTWEDVTEQKNAEREILRLKDEIAQKAIDKYDSLFNSIDEGFCLIELIYDERGKPVDWFYYEANPTFEKQLGFNPVGKTISELVGEVEPYWFEVMDRVVKTGKPERFENYNHIIDRWFSIFPSRVGEENSRLIAVVLDDITERKRRELNRELLNEIGNDLSMLTSPDDIIKAVGERLGKFLHASTCIFADVDEEKNEATIHQGWNSDDVPSLKQTFRLGDYFGEEFRRAGRAGEAVIVNDTQRDERANAEAYRKLQLGAFVTVPFKQQGRWKANITVTTREPRNWRQDEMDLVYEIANRVFPRIERARAEEALRESQKRFQSIANLVPDLLWDSEPNGSTNWYNDRWLAYTGQRFEQAIGWGWVDTIHPDDREGSAKRYTDAVKSGTALRQEHRIRRYDGEYRWFVVTAFPLKDEDGKVIKMYGAATDIHDRKQAEEALQQAHEAYRIQLEQEVRDRTLELIASRDELEREQHFLEQVTDKAPLLIYVYDLAEERFTYINKRVEELIGKTEEYIYAMGPHLFQAILHPEDLSRYTAYMKGLKNLSGGQVTENDFRIWNGSQFRWFRSRDSVFREEKKHVLQVIGIAEDVTYEKMLEDKLQSKGPAGLN